MRQSFRGDQFVVEMDGALEARFRRVALRKSRGVEALEIALGAHTCARLRGRTVRCWGINDVGQLGNSTTTSVASTT